MKKEKISAPKIRPYSNAVVAVVSRITSNRRVTGQLAPDKREDEGPRSAKGGTFGCREHTAI